MEVGPTCHYMMGGVRVDAETGESIVPGLFATGECSGGMNGANRLGGNSLSDILVFGKRAGDGAAIAAGKAPAPQLDPAELDAAAAEMVAYFDGAGGGEDPFALRSDLQTKMQADVGIFREEAGIRSALKALDEFDERLKHVRSPSTTRVYNPGWHLCRDLRNMLIVARAAATAALQREESRGAHSRLDFPGYADYWVEHNVILRDVGGEMQFEHRPVQKSEELRELVEQRQAAEAAP